MGTLTRRGGAENASVNLLGQEARPAAVRQISVRVLWRNSVGDAPKRLRKQRLK